MGEISFVGSSQPTRVLAEDVEHVCTKLEKQVAKDVVNQQRIQKSLLDLSEAWNQFDTEYSKDEEGDNKCQDYLRLEARKDEVKKKAENVKDLGALIENEDEEHNNPGKSKRRIEESKYTQRVVIVKEQDPNLQEFITENISISRRMKTEFEHLYADREIINYDESVRTKKFYDIKIDKFPEFIKNLQEVTNIEEQIIKEIQDPCNPEEQFKIFSGNPSGQQRKYGVYASMLKPGGLTVDVAYAYFSMDANFASHTSLPKRNPKPGHTEEEVLVQNFIKYKTMNAFLEAGIIKRITYEESEKQARSNSCTPFKKPENSPNNKEQKMSSQGEITTKKMLCCNIL